MDLGQILTFVENAYSSYGPVILYIGSFIEISPLGWLIPGAFNLAAAGYFADSPLSLFKVIVGGSLGALTSLMVGYLLGEKTGNFLIKLTRQQKNAKRARAVLEKHGEKILATSLLSPPLRFWIAYAAGSQGYHFLRFFTYALLASLVWTTLWSIGGYLAKLQNIRLESQLGILAALGWLITLLSFFVIYFSVKVRARK